MGRCPFSIKQDGVMSDGGMSGDQDYYSRLMDDYVFRRATAKDKDGILDILPGIECFDGWDYLPTYINHMLKCELFQPFVCVIGNEIIAFTVIQSVDDGTVALLRGSRVKTKYQGHQIHKHLSEYAMKCAVVDKQFTRFVEVLDCDQKCAKYMYRNMFKRTIFKERYHVFTWGRYLQKFFQEQQTSTQNVSNISIYDLIDLFRHETICDELFPQNRIIVDWVPYGLTESSIRFLTSDISIPPIFVIVGHGVARSLSSIPRQSLEGRTEEKKEHGKISENLELNFVNLLSNSMIALSIGFIRKAYIGINYTMSFYGNDTFLEEHLICHMNNLKHVIKPDDYLNFAFEIDKPPNFMDVQKKFREYIFKMTIDKTEQYSFRVFEKHLHDDYLP